MDSLSYGGIDLTGSTIRLGDGTDLGAADTLTAVIERLLTDGEAVTGTRSGNREIGLPLVILTGSRATAVALESKLAAQVKQPYTPLVWTPDGGVATVFDCFRGRLVREWNTQRAGRGVLALRLTVPALPFARSLTKTVLAPTAAVPLTIDSLDAASGSRTITQTGHNSGGTLTYDTVQKVEGVAALRTTNAFVPSGAAYVYTTDTSFAATDFTIYPSVLQSWGAGDGLASLKSQGYLFDAAWTLTLRSAGGTATWKVIQDPSYYGYGQPMPWQTVAFPIGQTPTSTTGTFNKAAVTSAAVTWGFTNNTYPYQAINVNLWRDYLRAVPANGLTITTPSGTARLDNVAGDVRTPVDLTVTCTGGTANRLLVARYPNPPGNFDPILQNPGTGTTATSSADSTALSGTKYSLGPSALARYTRNAVSLRGPYTVMARIQGQGSASTIQAVGYVSTDSTGAPQTTSASFTAAQLPGSVWQIVSLGQIALPPRSVPSNSTAVVNIDVNCPTGGVYVDQIYLVDPAGDSVLIDLGTSRAYSIFSLTAPDPTGSRGDVLAGTLTDKSDWLSATPWLTGQPILNLDPGTNLVLVVADRSTSGVGVQVEYYPRYHVEVPS